MVDQVLAIDAGTTSTRVSVVGADGTRRAVASARLPPATPGRGLVEFDPVALADAVVELSRTVLRATGRVAAIGIANQRCSTVVWDRATGVPVGPGIGWQDDRTAGRSRELVRAGFDAPPQSTALKAEWLLSRSGRRAEDLCVGTVDSWLLWTLSNGRCHATDTTNADTSRAAAPGVERWDEDLLGACGIPVGSMPRIVASAGPVAEAVALPGAPVIAGLLGDQQAALVGLGCTPAGAAKATLGTGAVVSLSLGTARVGGGGDPHGTVTLAGWRDDRSTGWVVEATMLSCGSALEWLRHRAGWFASFQEISDLAASTPSPARVVFVPALHGLGAPTWDGEARGCLFGLDASTTRAEVARAVLEGIAQRVADLVDATERASGRIIPSLRVDGGLAASAPLVQALADAIGRPVLVSEADDATTLGAALLAGGSAGLWPTWDDPATPVPGFATVRPGRRLDRDRWAEACRRSRPL